MLTSDWRKSLRSVTNNHCVEVRIQTDLVEVRDSKSGTGPTLKIDPHNWMFFLEMISNGKQS
jgi:hypothetical protein